MTTIWDEIIGQPDAIKRLQAAAEERSSHAFLFSGPQGVGKNRTAKAYAAALNCEKKGCGVCLSCAKVRDGIHPDVVEIEPEGDFLTLDQIRSIQHIVYLRASEGKAKVFVIDEADRMTPPAANAFLKTLEEPPEGSVFVLLTCRPESVLPTVASRCQNVRFNPISSAAMKKFLVERTLDEKTAEQVSRASGGVLGKAITLAESEGTQKRRRDILSFLSQIEKKETADLLDEAQTLVSAQGRGAGLSEEQQDELEEMVDLAINKVHATHVRKTYAQREKRRSTRKEHDEIDMALDFISSWYSDLLYLKQRLDQKVVNRDFMEALEGRAAVVQEEKILKAIEAIRHTREMIRQNVNSLLAVEAMLIRLRALS